MDENAGTIGLEANDFAELTADLVSAYVSNNSVPVAELPALIASTHAALAGLGQSSTPHAPVAEKLTPAQIRKSITPDALISFIDGKPYKTLKRHLTRHGFDPRAYRERYGLPADYPMTTANYSAMRAEFARSNRLGHQRRPAAPEAAEAAETIPKKPKRAGRPRKGKEASGA